jgi:hypothetical protein
MLLRLTIAVLSLAFSLCTQVTADSLPTLHGTWGTEAAVESSPTFHDTWSLFHTIGGLVVSSGNVHLPVPVKFPPGIWPVGGQALNILRYQPGVKAIIVSFYFPTQEEQSVRDWISRLQTNPPYEDSLKRFVVLRPHPFAIHIIHRSMPLVWRFDYEVRGDGYDVDYSWLAMDNIEPDLGIKGDVMYGVDFGKLFRGPSSPTRHEDRLISLKVYFKDTKAHADVSSDSGAVWLPLKRDGNAVVCVGHYDILTPIILPADLHYLPQAAVTLFDKHQMLLDIYFKETDEGKVLRWASNMPREYPLAAGTYEAVLTNKPYFSQEDLWSTSMGAQTKHGGVSFFITGTPGLKEILASQLGRTATSIVEEHPEQFGAGSPVSKFSRIVYIGVGTTYK